MIVRILTEGQWDVPDAQLDSLNTLDAAVERAVETGDAEAFTPALEALLHAVRDTGSRHPDDDLADSDLILPPSDATLEEVREMLGEEGLIPG
jgi:hypothetical protein